MDGRRDIKDLVGEVIDTERSTSRRNSIVQSERCGAHAEATSEASRSGTRFLPTDINQLSRVTNERRIGTKLFHGPPYVHACIHKTRGPIISDSGHEQFCQNSTRKVEFLLALKKITKS